MRPPRIRQLALRCAGLMALLCSAQSHADLCPEPISANKVSGKEHCLLMRQYGSRTPETLLIWLHGDVSAGGPANYHFPIAEKATAELGSDTFKSIALVRPSYPDGSGEESGHAFGHGGRSDHYTDKNLGEIIGAIERLKDLYHPKRTVLVGHSGGAASAAIILGMAPATADAALLVAIPGDLRTWRAGRRHWSRSENPIDWAGKVAPTIRVIALTGDRDTNTWPELAQQYTQMLQKRGVGAETRLIEDADHNSAFRAPEVTAALRELVADTTTHKDKRPAE